ncbi:MAG: TVP38/TMEM64 family protein [Clostridia bacterium]|nr:TVP38/TMEM64 family protein [Clostridia bacterium]
MTDKHKKLTAWFAGFVFVLFFVLVAWRIGVPMVRFVSQPQEFRAWVDAHGFGGKLLFVGMVILQVIVAIIPGEPLEIGAGYAFGTVEGTLLCLIGIAIGSTLVFLLVRKLGVRLVEVFFPVEKIRSLRFLQDSQRLNRLTFLIFFIPGTPKDLLSYFVGLTDMKLSVWVTISFFARIPSVITSTLGGDALGTQSYLRAAIVFGAAGLLSAVGLYLYHKLKAAHNARKERRHEAE